MERFLSMSGLRKVQTLTLSDGCPLEKLLRRQAGYRGMPE
jgi:hypothetical protein